MKTGNVTHIITGLNDGGAEAVLYRLCTHDTRYRHTVVSLMDGGKYGPLLEEAGIALHCLHLPRGKIHLKALWQLWKLLRTLQPDVVQTWMYHGDLIGGAVARLAGIRTVVWGIHHTTLVPGQSPRSTIAVARLLARLSHWVPRHIVACAHKAAEVHGELGYNTQKMTVIANGYNLSSFAPNAAARKQLRQDWQVANCTPLLGMIGRFDPQKDHANLLYALARLREQSLEFQCVMIGTNVTPENTELIEQITNLDLQDSVRLLGRRTDIPAVMNALDLHVLPSAFGEAFPNVLAEAMACGTPCVATDVGDAAVIVGDTGWIVPPRQPEALARALEQALQEQQNTVEWSQRQQAARQHIVDHFSIEQMITSYHKTWEQAYSPTPSK